MKKVFIHPLPERFWHWIHVSLILILLLSGFHIHFPEFFKVFGNMRVAVAVHNFAGIALVIDYLFWLVYNSFVKDILQYFPTPFDLFKGMIKQARFYLFGIFKGEPHPFETHRKAKFNPLQKIAYFFVMVIFLPLQMASGILMLSPLRFEGIINALGGLRNIAVFHTGLAYVFAAFVLVHIYLGTTGEKPVSLFKAMITGYEERGG